MPSQNENGKITLRSPSGSSEVEVLQYGATVISWKHKGSEQLFLSKKTPLDGSAAIRGGIPIVFPVFGSPTDHEDHKGLEKLPKHGFARTSHWEVGKSADSGDQSSVVLELDTRDKQDIQAVYPYPLHLRYTVSVSDASPKLECTLSVQYEKGAGSNEKMRFHALLHNYIRVPDVTTSSVSGLKGVRYMDKNANKQIFTEESESIVSKGQASDRVYQGGAPEVILSANDASGKQVRVSRTQTFPDTTVWNPAEEGAKGMKDLHEGGWKEYICIEPGQVSSLAELQAGNEWSATQTLEIIEGKSKV